MKMEQKPRTEVGQRRSARSKEHAKPGITAEEANRLSDEALHLFPPAEEERRRKMEDWMAMPEFVL
jgi:hypothetical protein